MGAVIEFLGNPPSLVSAGHDGLYPYEYHPYDEIFIIAYRWGDKPGEQEVKFWLPHNDWLIMQNLSSIPTEVLVHRSGFLWHDRVREVKISQGARWLSEFGFTSANPSNLEEGHPALLAVLPGSPMQDSFENLLVSNEWKSVRDFHTRKRDWMPTGKTKVRAYDAQRFERDSSLVEELKRKRGAACQICSFTFKKINGDQYCEVHHLEALANGGLDVASNCLVLCANCHKRFHYGNVEIISHTSSRLIARLDGEQYSCIVG